MSIYSLGARSAVLALMLALALSTNASAGNWASGCVLDHNEYCFTSSDHTYDDHKAYAPSDLYYIASWLMYPTTGAHYHISYGYGSAVYEMTPNTTTVLRGGWGNYSGYNDVLVTSSFDY